MTQAPRSKSCEKKIKTAEMKMLKIINKIESLKLNSSYISRLEIMENSLITLPVKNKTWFFVFVVVLMFLYYGTGVYNDFTLNKVRQISFMFYLIETNKYYDLIIRF